MGEYTVPEVFGRALIEWRSVLGLSQRELAAACDVHKNTIHTLETGQNEPRGKTLRRVRLGMSRLLGRQLSYEDISRGPIEGVEYVIHRS